MRVFDKRSDKDRPSWYGGGSEREKIARGDIPGDAKSGDGAKKSGQRKPRRRR